MRKNGLEAQKGEIIHRHFRRIKGELTDLKDQKQEITTHRHFRRTKGEHKDTGTQRHGDIKRQGHKDRDISGGLKGN